MQSSNMQFLYYSKFHPLGFQRSIYSVVLSLCYLHLETSNCPTIGKIGMCMQVPIFFKENYHIKEPLDTMASDRKTARIKKCKI
jgi:hypothetical protein